MATQSSVVEHGYARMQAAEAQRERDAKEAEKERQRQEAEAEARRQEDVWM